MSDKYIVDVINFITTDLDTLAKRIVNAKELVEMVKMDDTSCDDRKRIARHMIERAQRNYDAIVKLRKLLGLKN